MKQTDIQTKKNWWIKYRRNRLNGVVSENVLKTAFYHGLKYY